MVSGATYGPSKSSGAWDVGGFPVALEAVTLPVRFQDVDVVGETVQQGSGEAFRPEHLGPLALTGGGGHAHVPRLLV